MKSYVFAGKEISKVQDISYELLQEELFIRVQARVDTFISQGGKLTNESFQVLVNESIEGIIADVDALARQLE